MQIFIIKQVHVKSINVTIKHVTKGIQRIEDMDTSANFRQNAYVITKKNNKERPEEHRKEIKRMTEHITIMISETALLSIEINIKVNNIV